MGTSVYINHLLKNQSVAFPRKLDLAVLTYDIIGSSELHGIAFNGTPIRSLVLNGFTECVLKNGGWRESSAGDSAYGHFGMIKSLERPAERAYAAASEFRVFLINLSQITNTNIECGLGLHLAPDSTVDIEETKVFAFNQAITHKSIQSASIYIDLVHRMEKFMHQLPGSNICISRPFLDQLMNPPTGLLDLGSIQFKGQRNSTNVFIKLIDKVTDNDLCSLKMKLIIFFPAGVCNQIKIQTCFKILVSRNHPVCVTGLIRQSSNQSKESSE